MAFFYTKIHPSPQNIYYNIVYQSIDLKLYTIYFIYLYFNLIFYCLLQ